eukprot:1146473-Pelagomonas_calceolata.AAC.4
MPTDMGKSCPALIRLLFLALLQSDKWRVAEKLGIQARDLRLLDPQLSTTASPCAILCRDRSIIVNLEHIKAIITVDKVLLVNYGHDEAGTKVGVCLAHAHIHTHAHTHARTRARMHTHTHTHTNTHTHTQFAEELGQRLANPGAASKFSSSMKDLQQSVNSMEPHSQYGTTNRTMVRSKELTGH